MAPGSLGKGKRDRDRQGGGSPTQWKGALYAGKRAKLRKIAFAPAAHEESGKIRPVSPRGKQKAEAKASTTCAAKPAGEGGNVMQGQGGTNQVSDLNEWRVMFSPGAGLHNLGNTCFMNSVLQCLTYTPPLAQSCLDNHYDAVAGDEASAHKFDAMRVFQGHVNQVLRAPGKVAAPHKFSRSLKLLSGNKFRLGRQEDAHEYFRCLVESMEKAITTKLFGKKPTQEQTEQGFIFRVFGGKLRSQIHCVECGYKSNKYDPILDLSLEVFRTRSLDRALRAFTSKEILDGQNKYSCPKCKHLSKAVKQMLVSRLPNVLAIQLKRFAFGKHGMKIDNNISYPSRLDMSQYVAQPSESTDTYQLYGVLVHSGHSLHSGHYYCYVRCPSGAWVCCDDSSVTQVSEKRVLEQKAYMLFYCREGSPAMVSKTKVPAGAKVAKAAAPAAESSTSSSEEEEGLPTPRSPPRKAPRHQVGSPGSSPRRCRSPSLKNSRWRRFLLFLPRMRLQVASGMNKVVKELRTRRSVAEPLREEALKAGLRRSERIQLKGGRKGRGSARSSTPPSPSPSPSSSPSPAPASREHGGGGGGGKGPRVARGKEVGSWLRGDGGKGPYGLDVAAWDGEQNGEQRKAAGKLFGKLRPKQAKRDRYDEEYDAGKLKKVKQKLKPGRKRLGSQGSAFQRAAKGKYDAKSRRKGRFM